MNFGLTDKEKHCIDQARIVDEFHHGLKKFAYIPVRMEDGTFVWWEYFYAYPVVGRSRDNGEFFIWNLSPESDSPRYRYYHTNLAPRQLPK